MSATAKRFLTKSESISFSKRHSGLLKYTTVLLLVCIGLFIFTSVPKIGQVVTFSQKSASNIFQSGINIYNNNNNADTGPVEESEFIAYRLVTDDYIPFEGEGATLHNLELALRREQNIKKGLVNRWVLDRIRNIAFKIEVRRLLIKYNQLVFQEYPYKAEPLMYEMTRVAELRELYQTQYRIKSRMQKKHKDEFGRWVCFVSAHHTFTQEGVDGILNEIRQINALSSSNNKNDEIDGMTNNKKSKTFSPRVNGMAIATYKLVQPIGQNTVLELHGDIVKTDMEGHAESILTTAGHQMDRYMLYFHKPNSKGELKKLYNSKFKTDYQLGTKSLKCFEDQSSSCINRISAKHYSYALFLYTFPNFAYQTSPLPTQTQYTGAWNVDQAIKKVLSNLDNDNMKKLHGNADVFKKVKLETSKRFSINSSKKEFKKGPNNSLQDDSNDGSRLYLDFSKYLPRCLHGHDDKINLNNPTMVMYRIYGNDMPPLQMEGQLFMNLKYTLMHETYNIPNLEKKWVLNKIVDKDKEQLMLALLKSYGYTVKNKGVIVFPFDVDEFRKLPNETEIIVEYAQHLNTARNKLLDMGRSELNSKGKRNDWVMVFDGNQFITDEAMRQVSNAITDKKLKSVQYISLPMGRITEEQNETWLRNDSTLDSLFKKKKCFLQEPQLMFRYDGCERFDENNRYGKRSKLQLLYNLGCGFLSNKQICADAGYTLRLYPYPEKIHDESVDVITDHSARNMIRKMAIQGFQDKLLRIYNSKPELSLNEN